MCVFKIQENKLLQINKLPLNQSTNSFWTGYRKPDDIVPSSGRS